MKKTKPAAFFIAAMLICFTCFAQSAAAAQPPEGEEALFTTSMSPDALIVLDLSGSMLWTPAGRDMYTSSSASCGNAVAYYTESGPTHTKLCRANPYNSGADSNYDMNTPRWSNTSCTGPFYFSSTTGYTTDCRRYMIARRALFEILDDNGSGTINSADEGSLGVRIGYMRFRDGDDTGGDYSAGNNRIIRAVGSKYSLIYCAGSSSCTIGSTSSNPSVVADTPSGGTPLAASLNEAKLYLDAHKAGDSARDCRQKFVILISDGADTFACGGNGQEAQADQDRRRRESVARAKALADAGYKAFVIGFGVDMPLELQNTLNWMAYLGGTDNPNQANAGSTTGYDPAAATTCGPSSAANDPGTAALSGYAFLASDADQLGTALKTAINIIRQANYSFSQASVQSVRVADENHLYEGSFVPVDDDPFWKGHLKKYQISADGSVGAELWDAGVAMQSMAAADRVIKTLKGGVLTDFTTANITAADVGVATDALRDGVVGYIRGEAAHNPEQNAGGQVWKLGDVFRSTPITVGTPSAFFDDARDSNNQFASHRSSHPRTSAGGNRLIVVGANDGQLHAVKTSDGTEAWSFIPPNLLTKLKNMTHASHPTSLAHQYFVDGAVNVADVWLGSGDGTSKTADWRTIMIFGQGRGAVNYAWSSSTSCDGGISGTYSAATPYYCGYWALNLNDSLNPAYMWRMNVNAGQAPYVGDPWSKMMTGRVRIASGGAELEKWVGFVGGGYNAGDCSGGGACDPRGKGFFVVDLANGDVLWSYTMADNSSDLLYSMPATPAIVDTDNDGFIDTVYIGDMGGNMWRLKFCVASDSGCGTADWTGGLFFDSSSGNIRPIYTSAAVAKDKAGNLWVYWGTGDKSDPTAANAQEHFYGVKDNDRTSTYTVSNIDNITTAAGTYSGDSSRVGYRILMTGMGTKILADPTVFGGVVYFTTYTPPSGSNPCLQGGTATLYAINYTTGGGALPGGVRDMSIGTGIASAPVVSLPPDSGPPDLYVTTSGGGGMSASTQRANITPAGELNRTNMLYWRDLRIQ